MVKLLQVWYNAPYRTQDLHNEELSLLKKKKTTKSIRIEEGFEDIKVILCFSYLVLATTKNF